MEPNTIVAIIAVLTLLLLVVAIIKLAALAKSVTRLAEQIPGTGMTAKELATELGGSIETSFQKFMPQPEKISSAISTSTEASIKAALGNVESLHKKLLDAQDSVLDKWVAHEKTTTNGLGAISKALDESSKQFASGLTGGSQKMQASLDDGVKKLDATLKEHATATAKAGDLMASHLNEAGKQFASGLSGGSQKLQASLEDGVKKLDATMKEHAAATAKAAQQLTAQLDKIAALGKDIEKVLHVQQSTEAAIKTMAASEEFKKMLEALRAHLDASDKMLKEIAKPRTIRLVEQDK